MNKKNIWIVSVIFFILLIVFLIILFYPNSENKKQDYNDVCSNITPESYGSCDWFNQSNCTTTYYFYSRDLCYESLAINESDSKICLKIEDSERKEGCEYSITNFFNNTKFKTENYLKVLYLIGKGNEFVISIDKNDNCFPYRYFNRGCYYVSGKYDTTLYSGSLQYYNLTHSEIVDLCQKFVHKGAVAYCLKSNNEKEICLEFAEDNDYLKAICELEEDEELPVEFNNGFEYCAQNKCYPFMKYSDLI